MSFNEVEHTADRAFHVTGRDMTASLENAALAMRALDGRRPTTVPPATREIEVEGLTRESLPVNSLNERDSADGESQLVAWNLCEACVPQAREDCACWSVHHADQQMRPIEDFEGHFCLNSIQALVLP
jgi:SHS2 domain-containing protein